MFPELLSSPKNLPPRLLSIWKEAGRKVLALFKGRAGKAMG